MTTKIIGDFSIEQEGFLIRIAAMMIAQIFFSLSYAILIALNIGAHSLDIIVIGLSRKLS